MTERERRLIARAELAALQPEDGLRVLHGVVEELRALCRSGRLKSADRVLAGMLSGTSRLVCLAALADLDKLDLDADPLGDLLAFRGRQYDDLLAREQAGEADDLARARDVRANAEQSMQERQSVRLARQRDDAFLARLQRRRSQRGKP